MKKRILKSVFSFLEFILICLVIILIIKNTKWAGRKCESSLAYSQYGFEFGASVFDDEGKSSMYSDWLGEYHNKNEIIEINVDCSSLVDGSITLVVAKVSDSEAYEFDIAKKDNYTLLAEYEITDTGKYIFVPDNITDGWYLFFIKSENNVDKAEGSIQICTYYNNWDNIIRKIKR